MGLFRHPEESREVPLTREQKIAEHLGKSIDFAKPAPPEVVSKMDKEIHQALENAEGEHKYTVGLNAPMDEKGNPAFKNEDILKAAMQEAGIDWNTAKVYEADTIVSETDKLDNGELYTKEILGNPKSIVIQGRENNGAVVEYSPDTGTYIAPREILNKYNFKEVEE